MDISLLNYSGEILCRTNFVKSSYIYPKFNGIGTAEFHFDTDCPILDTILTNRNLFLKPEGKTPLAVTGFIADTELSVFCRTLNWFLSETILPPVTYSQMTVNEIISDMLTKTCGVPFTMAADSAHISEPYDYETQDYTRFDETVIALLELAGAGHSVSFSEDELYLHILGTQKTNIFISASNGNAKNVEYKRDVLSDFSGAAYKDEQDGTWKIIQSTESGLCSRYTVLSASNESEAETQLARKNSNDIISAEIQRLEYGKDFNLGDIVRVQYETENYIKTAEKKIIGVEVSDEKDGHTEKVHFEGE